MNRYKSGEMREQIQFIPLTIDEAVAKDSIVRIIDLMVDNFDMKELGFKNSTTCHTGNPPYNPKDLFKLYLYGYFDGVRSSRKLERETYRNIEVIWLMRSLHPDFKTIADFRKDNVESIRKAFKQFNALCNKHCLFGGETVGLDGTKIKAVNNRNKVHSADSIKNEIKWTEERLQKYMQEIEQNDIKEAEEEEYREKLKKAYEGLVKRKACLETYKEKIEHEGGQIAETDEDCRLMRIKGSTFDAAYNMQVTVDAKNRLILDYEVTNDTSDIHQLEPMAKRAKDILQVEELELLADAGYHNAQQIKNCEEEKITTYIPDTGKVDGIKFRYDEEADVYECPQGRKLEFESKFKNKQGRSVRRYRSKNCEDCPMRSICTQSKKGRSIKIDSLQPVVERMKQRVETDPRKARMRSGLCEHPFGILKQNMGFRYFLLKGLRKVNGEAGLMLLAYNLKRVVNILKRVKFTQNLAPRELIGTK